mmetsp:Transcript_86086/g.248566  ORF Transcript_86086/g.248566 Transcript_86086/m.248566 type:complete len:157 (+) Transcript_86086:31-501(+)
MKTSAIIAAGLVASAQGFAPATQGRVAGTQLSESLFDRIFGLDLFEPVKDQNNYGARAKKNLKIGEIQDGKSYVPAGLSAAEYNKFRATEAAKKKAKYEANVKKAGVFEDFTEWYKKRGTDASQSWAKSATRGHRMAKTKYDWSGLSDKPLWAKKS